MLYNIIILVQWTSVITRAVFFKHPWVWDMFFICLCECSIWSGVGVTKPISSILLFSPYFRIIKIWTPVEIKSKFNNCHHSSAVVTPARYKRDLENFTYDFLHLNSTSSLFISYTMWRKYCDYDDISISVYHVILNHLITKLKYSYEKY